MTFHIITLFPESMDAYLGSSILKRAENKGLIDIRYYNPRHFVVPAKGSKKPASNSKREKARLTYAERRVDDRPYGGGPGMVIEALPVICAIAEAMKSMTKFSLIRKANFGVTSKTKIMFFSPSGKLFDNKMADKYKTYTDIILICGRYEGIDARVKKVFPMTDISIGPYVLTGGELPAMVVIDSITRRIPGVLGHEESIEEQRIASPDVYTRPETIEYKGKKYKVPKILLSGHHKNIDSWKMRRKSQ